MLNRKGNTSINLSGAQNGDILRILVEEYGRANTGGIDPKVCLKNRTWGQEHIQDF